MVKLTDCLVNEDADSYIFEWWNNCKKVTIYVNKDLEDIYVLKVLDNVEIMDTSINTRDDLLEVWSWLNS